jgi:hypothetical protein
VLKSGLEKWRKVTKKPDTSHRRFPRPGAKRGNSKIAGKVGSDRVRPFASCGLVERDIVRLDPPPCIAPKNMRSRLGVAEW